MKRIEGEWRYFDEALQMPYPWYTKPALTVLDRMVLNRKRIFEFGAGDSTLWFREKGAQVWSVDNNMEWATKINCDFQAFYNEYVSTIDRAGEFNIICVDGVWRDECVIRGWDHLKKGGLMIVDNYKQASVEMHWPKTEELIKGKNYTIHKEPDHYDWQTLMIIK
jgi:hypothetical protein